MMRSLQSQIVKDLDKKIVLLSGPRQVGKTTLSKDIFPSYQYLNYDDSDHRALIRKQEWLKDSDLIVLDELHKMRGWKRWIKGIYVLEGVRPRILVTGSAQLDIARKMGDSLAGRHFSFRLHPFGIKELSQNQYSTPEKNLVQLLEHGGFPEPFLSKEPNFSPRWRHSHLDQILRQDLLDLEQVRQISTIELLVSLLRSRVGSPISYSSLAEDLGANVHSVKRWLTILENLFIIFRLTPWHQNVARSLLKTPKFYFYDTGQVDGDEGARFENVVATALFKEIQEREDLLGESWKLHYLRDKDGHEVDFLLLGPKSRAILIEVKWSDSAPAKALLRFGTRLKFTDMEAVQLVGKLRDERQISETLTVRRASTWLEKMPF